MKLKTYIKKDNDIPLKRPKGVSSDQWVRAISLYEAAKNIGDKFPELTVAQAALETGWFKKESGKNNFFGQKATVSQAGSDVNTHEVYKGKKVKIKDRFRDYDTIEESLKDRKKKWMSKYDTASTSKEAIGKIWSLNKEKNQGQGYATDPNYGDKISSILDMMGATQQSQIKVEKNNYKENIEYPTQKIDNTKVTTTLTQNIPNTTVPQYTSPKEISKEKIAEKQEQGISQDQLKEILQKERSAMEQQFLEAYKSTETQPQQEVEPSRDLYQYIDPNIQSYL